MGNSPWSHKELDMTERLTYILFLICVGQEKWNRKKKRAKKIWKMTFAMRRRRRSEEVKLIH